MNNLYNIKIRQYLSEIKAYKKRNINIYKILPTLIQSYHRKLQQFAIVKIKAKANYPKKNPKYLHFYLKNIYEKNLNYSLTKLKLSYYKQKINEVKK